GPYLQRRVVGLTRTDSNDALDLGDEDLSITDLPRFGGLENGFDDLIHQVATHGDLDPCLGDEVDDVLSASVQLSVATLPSESLHFGDGHAGYTDVGQRGTHVVELERFDDRSDQFHVALSVGVFDALVIRKVLDLGLFAAFMPRTGMRLSPGI